MKSDSSRQLELLSCIRQSLPFMDRRRIYRESRLKKNGTPDEFSYHFELYRVLSAMAYGIVRVVASEARNAAQGINRRLDIYVASNGNRSGFELMADATEAQLISHYTDQAKIYKDALGLSELMVVNFISKIPDGNRPEWWFITEDPDITVIHVHLPSRGSYATIMRSLDPWYDEEINLATSNLRDHTAVNDIAQQISGVRIDESRDVSGVNFSKFRTTDPTAKVVVGDTLFTLASSPKISDFLADVKNEIVLGKGDTRLRLYSKKRKTFISAATETLSAFSDFQDDDMEVTCGDDNFPVTKK